ncbi:protein BOLA4, chloroplastic/mitochondrial [Carica papaya]|uniref:protein BOLA4, chloroplastic/mitochondrial n=1 Tax=Carica papaya TaxID=3649 RepID=UPI000B8CF8CB|nr:protein BOLA4, chloroplastic/mitochondrial [Carica papaya]XP_021887702.1 protein BOLA4, chloroplastic/mitochondrial [Carica papaya]
MAKTLVTTTRPYLSSPTTKRLLYSLPLFSQSQKRLVSQSTIFLSRGQNLRLSFSCKNNGKENELVYGDNSSVISKLFGYGLIRNRRFSTRATHVNDPGSIDESLMTSMEKKIKEHLNAESVQVKDTSGDGRHVVIDVISSAFEGQSAVNRQRMVYKAIWEELQNTVHAVDQMTTRTPAEVAARK